MRQYLDLISTSNPSSRDITYLIAINTKQIGIAAIEDRPQLVELCIHCFNSYMRATINNKDQRTTYYIMDQYRLLAEALLRKGENKTVREIAVHFQFYGHLGFKMKMPFLLEVADSTRVPAGGELAVDRGRFSAAVTEAIEAEPKVEFDREDGVVRAIRGTCACGQDVVIHCSYEEEEELGE